MGPGLLTTEAGRCRSASCSKKWSILKRQKTKLDVELKLRLGFTTVPQFYKDNYWKSVKFEADESCSVRAGRQTSEMRADVTKPV